MGRSRGNRRKNKDRAKRSRVEKYAQNVANYESTSEDNAYMTDFGLEPGQETSNVKTASYHCNYCSKDITGKFRIKCAVCPDFDLCVECFTVGAEVTPHKSNHAYRVMNSIPIHPVSPDWTDEEELLLLEGIDIFGLNWDKISEHVGTKDKDICINHYRDYYINSPFFPLPDLSRADPKKRVEIVEDMKVASASELDAKDKVSTSGVEVKEMQEGDPSELRRDSPSLLETSGCNSKKREIHVEYDIDAENLLRRIRQLELGEYLDQKRRSETEAEENSRLSSYSVEVSPGQNGGMIDLTRYPETYMLSESEMNVCCELTLTPLLFMRMQQVMFVQICQGTIKKRSDAHQVFSIGSKKIDRLYDMLVEKGLAPPP